MRICHFQGDALGVGFSAAYDLGGVQNLSSVAKELPEGTAICQPRMIAGFEHLQGILQQAREHWHRGQLLARNRSIDLLMRITCKRQISEAIVASGIERCDTIAIFGLVDSEAHAEQAMRIMESRVGSVQRRDELLLLTKDKEKYLKSLHKLPSTLSRDQLLSVLRENSALLIFSK